MPDAKNQCATSFGGIYDFYIERPRLAQLIGRVIWGIDVAPMYTSMSAIGVQSGGTTIADVPCGGGLALRSLRAEQDVKFWSVDIEPKMLDRTRAKADARGLGQVETIESDMRKLPFDDGSVDLLCTYSGLHMINDPENAVAEFARVLRPGGKLLGSSFVDAGSRRKRALFRAEEKRGGARPPRDAAQIAEWLRAAGFADVEVSGVGFVDIAATRG
jgi:ubiquinone/menaquinone biosynthesis C-methylase UbiE